MLTFLELNGVIVNCSDSELLNLGLGIATSELQENHIINFIRNHN